MRVSCGAVFLLLACLAGARSQPFVGTLCDSELYSEHLAQAVDAAITSLVSTPGWLLDLKTRNNYTHALDIFSCTPDAEKWDFPPADKAQGLLKRVLDNGELRVAGVQWSLPGAADYVTDPDNPTGFWPEYLTSIVDKLSEVYGKKIKLVRKYYQGSALLVDEVSKAEEVEMSEPYYYLSGFHNTEPRIEALSFSCSTAGTASAFFTKKDSGITTVDMLNSAISNGEKLVGFIGKGNYDSVSTTLSSDVSPVYLTNSSEINDSVESGNLAAGYLSEGGSSSMEETFNVFPSGVISPRVVLFRKEIPLCPGGDLQKIMRGLDGRGGEKGTASSDGGSTSVEIIIVIILAVLSLLLAGMLAFVIFKERKGSPMFMPLLDKGDGNEMSSI